MKEQNFLPKIIVAFKNMSYLCSINFEAIHNKDYSVVRTFGVGRLSRPFLLKDL